jgi:hypothetical protein
MPSKDTEGLAEYTTLHGLAPRLAQFRGRESAIPVDYGEILKAVAPRPVYLRVPTLDRYAVLSDVKRAAASAGSHVTLTTPVDFNRFRIDAQKEAFQWLARQQ